MQWSPQKPASHRVKLIAFTIAAIVVVVLVLGTVLAIWGLVGTAQLPD